MKLIFIVALSFPLICRSQINANSLDSGIQWDASLSWQKIKEKAKVKNKYIFVDCFTTWCGPCKRMDKEVYTDERVIKYINHNFISVKAQLDTTQHDDVFVQKWYGDAMMISSHYNVVSYPTYLFFDSNGNPVHKATGFQKVNEFIATLKDVFIPQKQFYSVLKNFEPGRMDLNDMKGLARTFKQSDKILSDKIAFDYLSRISFNKLALEDNLRLMLEFQDNPDVLDIAVKYIKSLSAEMLQDKNNISFIVGLNSQTKTQKYIGQYLSMLKQKDLLKPGNLQLMVAYKNVSVVQDVAQSSVNKIVGKEKLVKEEVELLRAFTTRSSDKGFNLFYRFPMKIDTAMKMNGYSRVVVDEIISKEEIAPAVNEDENKNIEPDWNKLITDIASKYNLNYAEKNVLWAKLNWYKSKKMIPQYLKYMIQYMEQYKTDTTSWISDLERNNIAWTYIFLHSREEDQINTGVKWMEGVVRRNNGKNPTFLDTYANLLYKAGRREEAIQMQQKAIELDPSDKSFKENLQKMVNGKPTWVAN